MYLGKSQDIWLGGSGFCLALGVVSMVVVQCWVCLVFVVRSECGWNVRRHHLGMFVFEVEFCGVFVAVVQVGYFLGQW